MKKCDSSVYSFVQDCLGYLIVCGPTNTLDISMVHHLQINQCDIPHKVKEGKNAIWTYQ